MYELPFDANVSCTDGRCGTSVAVTFNEATGVISHLIVEDGSGRQRFVPMHMVAEADREEVRLSCAARQLEDLPLFMVREYVERAEQQSGDWADDEGEWEDGVDVSSFERSPLDTGVPFEVERIPEGETGFYRGTEIEATDGHVGRVGALVVEPETGKITHLVLRKGRLWRKQNIRIPLTAVESSEPETVYLNVSKQGLEEFTVDDS